MDSSQNGDSSKNGDRTRNSSGQSKGGASSGIPDRYDHLEVEARWSASWEATGIYRFNPGAAREQSFVVDTPPPTVSGSLHIGHVFSYTQTDTIVRYQRMLGKNIMYPMGWDDNGLPTERRVQNKFGIRCDPKLSYDSSWQPKPAESKDGRSSELVSRRNFIEACAGVTQEDERVFEELWRNLALSVDWTQQYATIDAHCRLISQLSFIDLVQKGFLYSSESPTMWDIDFQTALAQADLEDRTLKGAYHDVRFGVEGGGEFVISTTRPELIVACIAVVAHPDDSRYQAYFGKQAITPLFHATVPILPSAHADPEKGTGIMMVCTWGDIADVEWWKASGLPVKAAIGKDGRMLQLDFENGPFKSAAPDLASRFYSELVGRSPQQARKAIADILARDATAVAGTGPALVGQPKPIEHPVKFYEKGERPIEFISTRQWFIRLLDHKQALLEQGKKIEWHPSHMLSRYTHWVEGLNHDWCISRQRFFGVPFPVWYPISGDGTVEYSKPIFAAADQLPVDPLTDTAPSYKAEQRDRPGGFCGDPDVMDTWATSSLTPQIVSHWLKDPGRHQQLFPMDLRPQAHEIIRTWAFYTIAKAWMHSGEIPWRNIVISGWILDPDRKKMSKSKGNVVTPKHLLEQYSADGVRYWASRARLGVDTAFDEKVFKTGQKLATKLFNAGRFVTSQIMVFEAEQGLAVVSGIVAEVDRAFVNTLRGVIKEATSAFERFDYAAALHVTEGSFWSFCDNYLELVKGRAYAESDLIQRRSAVATLSWALRCYLRLFAPFLPYVTEEVWSWYFARSAGRGKQYGGSVHAQSWPVVGEVEVVVPSTSAELLDLAGEVIGEVRSAKSSNEKSLNTPVSVLQIAGVAADLAVLRLGIEDIARAARAGVESVELREGAAVEGRRFSISVVL